VSTVRLDQHASVRCDCCGFLGQLVELLPGWRWRFDGWLFYAVGDVHLCPTCKSRSERLKRAHPTRPDASSASEDPPSA
jgi:hypothetical protein